MNAIALAELVEDQRERFLARPCGISRDVDFSRWMDQERIVAITGIRRCGKSTLLRQFAAQFNGAFHYLNFDDERLVDFTAADFDVLMQIFEGRSSVRRLLFDEIQNIPQWERFARRAHDDGYKLMVTGSNARLLSQELGTHLTGRCAQLYLTPFSFREYLDYVGVARHKRTTTGKAAILSAFRDYLASGGFPGYLKERDIDLLQQIYEDILYRDIVARHGVRDVRSFAQTAHYLLSTEGSEINYNKLRTHLSIPSANTVRQFIGFLESACLIHEIRRFDWSLKRQYISGRKIYVSDNGLKSAVAFQATPDYGRMLESLVFQELKRRHGEVWFFRERGECDFVVLDKHRPPLLYQTCYALSAGNREREWRGLLEAAEKLGVKAGSIITVSEEGAETTRGVAISIQSAWRWLLEDPASK
ncbi:MAG: ATP-binding protein [bacterium]